jgi:glutamine amidotransferase
MTKAIEKIGLKVKITRKSSELYKSDALILPGVGNFGPAAKKLEHLHTTIIDLVDSGRPLLGSCLGLQLLFEVSEESPGKGLGLIKGRVKKFGNNLKIPHMGWNNIKRTRDSPLLEGIPDYSYFYFVHSYYPDPDNPNDILATTIYGEPFTSIIEKDNIYSTQFHPEKSGPMGRQFLVNFASLVKK